LPHDNNLPCLSPCHLSQVKEFLKPGASLCFVSSSGTPSPTPTPTPTRPYAPFLSAALTDARDCCYTVIMIVVLSPLAHALDRSLPRPSVHCTLSQFLTQRSPAGGYNPAPPLGLYGVSKTALFGLTKLLATELGPEGIRVNCLAPGLVRTRFSEMLWKGDGTSLPPAMKEVEGNANLRRAGEPYEMASAVAFMCSSDGSYMTGRCSGGGCVVADLSFESLSRAQIGSLVCVVRLRSCPPLCSHFQILRTGFTGETMLLSGGSQARL
jgi:NAD(P)-dependent dehydrogenase (short-subunit alcohol dehydrogenase family)